MDTPEPCGRSRWDPSEDELPPEVLQTFLVNPTRRRILELVQSRPGLNQNQIAETLDCTTSTITHHLARLERTHHIITVKPKKSREKLCFTPDNVHLWQAKPCRILLGRATPRKVAGYLTRNPGVTTRQIAGELELSIATIQRHIRHLQDVDLVQGTRVDRNVVYHARPRLVEWMERVEGEEP